LGRPILQVDLITCMSNSEQEAQIQVPLHSWLGINL
jgi:hypothetical protein